MSSGSQPLPALLAAHPEHEEALRHLLSPSSGADGEELALMKTYFTVFRRVTRQWARGEIAPPDLAVADRCSAAVFKRSISA